MGRGLVRAAARSAVLVLLVTACGEGDSESPTGSGLVGLPPEVHIFDAAVVGTGPGEADLSFRAHNAGSETDRLLSAACACDADIEIEGALTIAPQEEVVVSQGGLPALRLAGLPDRPRIGDVITVMLTFELAGNVVAEAEVRKAP